MNRVLIKQLVIVGFIVAMALLFYNVLISTLGNSQDSVTSAHRIDLPVSSLHSHGLTIDSRYLGISVIKDIETTYLATSPVFGQISIVPSSIAIIAVILDPAFLLVCGFMALMTILLVRFISHQTIQEDVFLRINHLLNSYLESTRSGDKQLPNHLDSHYVDMLSAQLENAQKGIQKLQYQSTHMHSQDKLTLLIDRHAYLKHLSRKLSLAEKAKSKCALLFIDLDGFKQVNDSFGHSYGDEVLIKVAKRLMDVARRFGISELLPHADGELDYSISRLGGDEFSVFIECMEEQDSVIEIAKAVLKTIETDFMLGNKIIKISASVGIAIYPDSAATPQSLLQMADVAMYRAKTDGRGIFKIYSPEMSNKLRRYHYLVDEMRLALASKNFTLTFQPIVHVEDCTIDYFEALVRWHHPVEGMIPPSEFIPVAEETNLILEMGDWIMLEACSQMSSWHHAGMKKVKMSVNVSGVQLRHRELHSWVSSILSKTNLPATSLMIEITETTLIQASRNVIDELEKCRAMGIIIAIDDFGTGFSSLSTLADLPIDVIKIDKQFISSAHDSVKYFKILQSITDLGRELGLKLVAEGVERTEQFELVKQLGISCVQGYLVSQPQSSARVNNKVLKANVNNVARTGTSVWLPES
ncbi:diguanylate cyclase/phosphodiesterase (GGDEF & EAL domains) with PAS/PAC sensor(s) [Pseudoalteromonas luteoviolacea B = ATCC 29581]|nr:diguanylate cyclase/phosphodiesterase (GGDEF & EAL domains) with PAS/PAC sensor(s) [Pseudoalteromonas luteoviolacea B = ATCC 29581]